MITSNIALVVPALCMLYDCCSAACVRPVVADTWEPISEPWLLHQQQQQQMYSMTACSAWPLRPGLLA
jgi:hypothetical protein